MDLKQLTRINAVTGHEQKMRRFLLETIGKIEGVSVKIDRTGNVIATKPAKAEQAGKGESGGNGGNGGNGGKTRKVLLTAPMDEAGLIVTGHTSTGFLKIAPLGNTDSRMAVSKRVIVGDEEINGVIGAKPIHLQSGDERKKKLPWDSLYADIGALTKEEAEKAAPKGTYIAFYSPYMEYGEGLATSAAVSSRASLMNLLLLLESDTSNVDLTCAFTTLRESEKRGAGRVVFDNAPDFAIVLGSCIANDMDEAEMGEMGENGEEGGKCCISALGKGVSITYFDKGALSSRKLYTSVVELCEKTGAVYQLQGGLSPETEAGEIQHSSSPVAVVSLSLPTRMLNSPSEIISLQDVESQLKLVKAIISMA